MAAPYHGFDQLWNWKVGEGSYTAPGLIQGGGRNASGGVKYERGVAGGGTGVPKGKERGSKCEVIVNADTIALLAYAVRATWPLALVPINVQVGNIAASRVAEDSLISTVELSWEPNDVWRAKFETMVAHEAAAAGSATQAAMSAAATFPSGMTSFLIGGVDLVVQKLTLKIGTGAHYYDGGSAKDTGEESDPLGVVGGWETYELSVTGQFDPGADWDVGYQGQDVAVAWESIDTGAVPKTWDFGIAGLAFDPLDYEEAIKKGDEPVEIDCKLTGERSVGTVAAWTYV